MSYTRVFSQSQLLFLFLLVVLQPACTPQQQWGSAEEGAAARTLAQSVEQANNQRLQLLNTYLAKFTTHPGMKILIDHLFLTADASSFPVPSVTNTQIIPHFGYFQETATGIFELVSASPGGISVVFLDGSTLSASVRFGGASNTELETMSISGSVTMDYTAYLASDLGISQFVGYVEGARLYGNVGRALPDGTPVSMQFRYWVGGHMQSPCYSLSKAIYGVFCDLSKPGLLQNFRGKAIETLSSSGWNYSANLTRYSPSEDTAQSGIWAARKTVKLVENDNLYYEVGVENTSTAVFIPFNSSYKSYGNVRITSNALPPSPYTVIVADTQGGPYTCDLSNPTLPTTGSNIMLNWSDDVVEPLLPNPQIGCPELVWQR